MDSRKTDLIAAAAFLATAAVMIRESFDEIYQASGVGVAQDAVFYPRIVLGAIVALALMLALQAWLGARPPSQAEDAPFRWRPVIAIIASTASYAALIPLAGYLMSTLLFVAVVPVLLGFRHWRAWALTVVLFPLGSWLLFTRVIKIPLPTGTFSFLG